MTPLRVLLSAYQCGPGMGSVSQIGWEWYSRLCGEATVTLVTHIRNRKALGEAGAPFAGSKIVYIDTEWFAGPLYRLACRLFPKSEHAVFLISSIDFFVYDAAALKILRKRDVEWDVVHAVTPVSPVAATRLHRLGIPLIVGPWNGGLPSPKAFREVMQQDSGWIYEIRAVRSFLDLLIGCTRNAALILTANKSTDRSVPKHARTQRMIENGVDLTLFQPAAWEPAPSTTVPLRVLFVGRLVPFKGISMLLKAIERVRSEIAIHLTIVGDGPLRGSLEQESVQMGLSRLVTFAGGRNLREIASYMSGSHLFCLPSIRESGGAVLLEAMASALPILAVNYGGPAELVDDEVGRPLSADGPENLILDMADAFRNAFNEPERWKQRGIAGRRRAERLYGWDARILKGRSYYRQLSGRDYGRSPK